MITLSSADNALKTLYLGVIAEQLNTNTNPLLAKIEQTTSDVWGKEVRKLAKYGINGGIGAGEEDGALPTASSNQYAEMVLTLKNLYGIIEISDKAMRASENNSGAFVNLLEAEMEGLIRASKFNFGRMLYGDGSGILAYVSDQINNYVNVDDVRNLAEGMVVDIVDEDSEIVVIASKRIESINRQTKQIKFAGTPITTGSIRDGYALVVQGSFKKELTGLGAVFNGTDYLYGLERAKNLWLTPYVKNSEEINDIVIQSCVDYLEETAGSQADFIVCSAGVRRAYQEYLTLNRSNVDVMNLAGGYKAMSYNGIPLVSDRFAPKGTMYVLNTADFHLHQLCDWRWLEDDAGRVLKQIAGKPVYSATLVKYADMICDRPIGQGAIIGITEK